MYASESIRARLENLSQEDACLREYGKLNVNFVFLCFKDMGVNLFCAVDYFYITGEKMIALKFDQAVFDQAIEVTNAWNFELAIKKLLEVKNGEWDLNRAEAAVRDYKRYMAVTKALGGVQLIPNGEIDETWHMHILDTRSYMKDCNELFGEYLHHFPYFGMLGEENRQQWLDVQSESELLWQKLFGEALYGVTHEAQKCPQVCPCHIDQIARGSSTISSMQIAA